ncbi:hypothetical protein CBL_04846 [Carabus blaptoides fortunei]
MANGMVTDYLCLPCRFRDMDKLIPQCSGASTVAGLTGDPPTFSGVPSRLSYASPYWFTTQVPTATSRALLNNSKRLQTDITYYYSQALVNSCYRLQVITAKNSPNIMWPVQTKLQRHTN